MFNSFLKMKICLDYLNGKLKKYISYNSEYCYNKAERFAPKLWGIPIPRLGDGGDSDNLRIVALLKRSNELVGCDARL